MITLYILIGMISAYVLYKYEVVTNKECIEKYNRSELGYFFDSEMLIIASMVFFLWPLLIVCLILYGVFLGLKWILDKTIGGTVERIIKKYDK